LQYINQKNKKMDKPIFNATFAATDKTLQKNLEIKKALEDVDRLRTYNIDLKLEVIKLKKTIESVKSDLQKTKELMENYKNFYTMTQKNLNEH